MSVAEACFGVGTMFGPSVGGFLYEVGGFSLPFWVSGEGRQQQINGRGVWVRWGVEFGVLIWGDEVGFVWWGVDVVK